VDPLRGPRRRGRCRRDETRKPHESPDLSAAQYRRRHVPPHPPMHPPHMGSHAEHLQRTKKSGEWPCGRAHHELALSPSDVSSRRFGTVLARFWPRADRFWITRRPRPHRGGDRVCMRELCLCFLYDKIHSGPAICFRNWFYVILTEVGLRDRIVCRGSRLSATKQGYSCRRKSIGGGFWPTSHHGARCLVCWGQT
jgi:hypothetical protein